MNHRHRRLSIPNLLNIRDLGGCEMEHGGYTRWRSILRSDDLARLAPSSLNVLYDYGVRTIIDLRWLSEIEVRPYPLQTISIGIDYFHCSLLGSNEADRST